MSRNLDIQMHEGYDNLFGEAGVIRDYSPRMRDITKYKIPTFNITKSGEMRLLICGRHVYDAITRMILHENEISQQVEGAGFVVSIKRTGVGIDARYEVNYSPDRRPHVWGFTGLAVVLIAAASAAAGGLLGWLLL